MSRWIDHLVILPVVVPLAVGALMLLIDPERRRLKAAINLTSTVALVAIAVALLCNVATPSVYLLGNWPSPFGIVLVADRLSALMLVLAGVLALAALVYSFAHWHRAGAYFNSLFQFQLMGLNGAFLTGDLFNLFVFFEVLLAASYGLALHGSGVVRVRASLHYIAFNLAASMLFLIGVSLIYGVTGTLNMADLAGRIPALGGGERMLLEAGAALLGITFLAKAGMWPLGFWLPSTYAAVSPPVAAFFAILSKVGVYAVLRLWLLLFGDDAGTSAHFGRDWLLFGGMMTIAFGAIGVLASQDLARLAGFSVLVSSGTLLAAIAMGRTAVTGATLYYLVSSTLALGALFMLIELIERGRATGADVLAVTREAFGEPGEDETPAHEPVGVAIPAAMALLGGSFLCCALVLSGMPPLSGFLAKFALLSAMLNPDLPAAQSSVRWDAWALLALLILSGLAAVIALTRAGIRSFWGSSEYAVPRIGVIEMLPVAGLLLLCVALTVQAGPVMRYMQATAQFLHAPHKQDRP
jgi:multicomponent K+:H+ antiporter subunit D